MESMHLIGAEDVRSAGNTISRAADTISSAAHTISEAMSRKGETDAYLIDALDRHTAMMERFMAFAVTINQTEHRVGDVSVTERRHTIAEGQSEPELKGEVRIHNPLVLTPDNLDKDVDPMITPKWSSAGEDRCEEVVAEHLGETKTLQGIQPHPEIQDVCGWSYQTNTCSKHRVGPGGHSCMGKFFRDANQIGSVMECRCPLAAADVITKPVKPTCHANRDGECNAARCPQHVLDNYQSHCPLDDPRDYEEQ